MNHPIEVAESLLLLEKSHHHTAVNLPLSLSNRNVLGNKSNLRETREKPRRKRKKKKQTPSFEPNINRSSLYINESIPEELDIERINELLGECLLYESLLIWEARVTEEYKTVSPSEPSDLLGDLFCPLRNYYRPIVNLLLQLPILRKLKHYDDVLKSGDTANLALAMAKVIILRDLYTSQAFESTDDIWKYYEEHINTNFIPKTEFVQTLVSTIGGCFQLSSAEGIQP